MYLQYSKNTKFYFFGYTIYPWVFASSNFQLFQFTSGFLIKKIKSNYWYFLVPSRKLNADYYILSPTYSIQIISNIVFLESLIYSWVFGFYELSENFICYNLVRDFTKQINNGII